MRRLESAAGKSRNREQIEKRRQVEQRLEQVENEVQGVKRQLR